MRRLYSRGTLIHRIVAVMGDSKRPPRHALTIAEAQAIAEDLRHDRRDRIEDVRFPRGSSSRSARMRGVSFTNSSSG